jgi:hypothetical protein
MKARKLLGNVMKHCRMIAFAMALLTSSTLCHADVRSRQREDTTQDMGLPREAAGQSATLLSAFFGLDNSLPATANRICLGTAGLDGMPVIFSTEIDHATIQAGDFRVITQSGAIGEVACVSFLPATDAGELRTVLLMGEFGNADADPPARVEIVGHVRSIDGRLDYKGAAVAVTPLEKGPTLVMAERFDAQIRDEGLGLRRTRGSKCPTTGTVQAVRVVWAGGVTLANDKEPGDTERQLYHVTVQAQDGSSRQVVPIALADLGDGDNNHLLCLDTADKPVSVAFPARILTDPNDDLNPETAIQVNP